jgi:tetratricopeptide (TPR) repeat protein
MARAGAEVEAGDLEAAAERYENVVDQNSNHSAGALLKLMWTRMDASLPIDAEMRALIGSHAREQRGMALGVQLAYAHVAAMASGGLYDEAIAYLSELSENASSPDRERTIEAVAELILSHANDLQFLKHFLPEDSFPWREASSTILLEVARRLLDLGFQDEARRYLSASNPGAGPSPRGIERPRLILQGVCQKRRWLA